jgi:addiction module HigA family antidote
MKKKLPPITPGMILLEEFMEPLGISQNKLARDIGVPPGRINQIIKGKRAISADTALRLGRYFNVSAESWIHLQKDYELRTARYEAGDKIYRSIRPVDQDSAPL